MLMQNGFEVYLVNSKHVKNAAGRKTDEDDAMWIQKLHRVTKERVLAEYKFLNSAKT